MELFLYPCVHTKCLLLILVQCSSSSMWKHFLHNLPFSWELPDGKSAAATTGEGVTITRRPGALFLHREPGKEPCRELSAGIYTCNVPDKNSLVQPFYILGYTSSSPLGKKTEI